MNIIWIGIFSITLQVLSTFAIVPGMYGTHFEGDMLLTGKQKKLIKSAIKNRNGFVDLATRWPNRTVVYEIKKNNFDHKEIMIIKIALSVIALRSCIKFRPRKGKEYAVVLQSTADGCFSHVGYIKNHLKSEKEQLLNLGKRCLEGDEAHSTVVHEMLHTLGFFHMQSAYNRNDYIKVIWRNIKSGEEHNFQRYSHDIVTNFGVPYDYESVMHYYDRAFSKNGKKTMIALEDNARIHPSLSLTEKDIKKLNRMYCKKHKVHEEDSKETKTIICIWPLNLIFKKYCKKD